MRFYNQKTDSVVYINTHSVETMEYKIESEEIHVTMINNKTHIIKLADIGSKAFDDILDYNFDLKR